MPEPSATGSLPVSAVMAENIVRLSPGAPLAEAVAAMVEHDVGLVVLSADDGEVERALVSAVVSERDIAHAAAKGIPLDTTPASDVASARLVWCNAESSVADAAIEMLAHYVRHVLVEEDGRLVGVVSARDLLGVYAAESAVD